MSNTYTVSDTQLISIADSIRSKGGTEQSLSFPQGFSAAISAIETGLSGSTLTVNAPEGSTVTLSKGEKSYSANGGVCSFPGLDSGTWTIVCTRGEERCSSPVEIISDYAVTMNYFWANLTISYPEGASCVCTMGEESYSAPDTSGSCTFTLITPGTWTVSCTNGSKSGSETISITENGADYSLDVIYKLRVIRAGEGVDPYFTMEVFGDDSEASITVNDDMSVSIVSSKNAYSQFWFKPQVDLTDWASMKVRFKGSRHWYVGISSYTGVQNNHVSLKEDIYEGEGELITLDVSPYKQRQHLSVKSNYLGISGTIYEWWLE